MTNPVIRMTTSRSPTGNADGWEAENFKSVSNDGTLTLKSTQTEVDIINDSRQLAYVTLSNEANARGIYGNGRQDRFDYADDLEVNLLSSSGGPCFATLTLTKGPGSGDD